MKNYSDRYQFSHQGNTFSFTDTKTGKKVNYFLANHNSQEKTIAFFDSLTDVQLADAFKSK
jgi:hypothetical protein